MAKVNIVDNTKARTPSVRWQSVALPTEHGGWSFIGEPLLLGLLVAPSAGGLALAIAAFGLFLCRQPFKLYAKDVRNHHIVLRTVAARRFVLIYSAITAIASMVTLALAPSLAVALPMLAAVPLVALQAAYELRGHGRHATAEVAGALATGAVAASIAMMQGWALIPALGLWLALAAKGVTAVLYVRSRLRLERGTPANISLTLGAHGFAVVALLIAAVYQLLPWTAPLAMLILALRAMLGLSSRRVTQPAKVIGMQEVIYGAVFVLLIVLGYRLG